MKRFLTALVCALLIVTLVMPVAGQAASKTKAKKDPTIYILRIEETGARLRSEATSANDNVITSLSEGDFVFSLGKTGAWCKVRTGTGTIGYVYEGFTSTYGYAKLSRIYTATGSTRVYKSPKTSSRTLAKLPKKQHVVVKSVSGKWAYVYSLSGVKGYVLKKNLKAAN